VDDQAKEVFTTANGLAELDYVRANPGFERPYGWGWLLTLHHELQTQDSAFAEAIEPLARHLGQSLAAYLPRLTYPIRTGSHSNTAFALLMSLPWAHANDPELADLIRDWSLDRFANDVAAPHVEPSGEDFLSPTLVEAALMAEFLSSDEFARWFQTYLPGLPANLMEPAIVSDRTDGRIAHLDGLNLSRAWCWRRIAKTNPPQAAAMREAADRLLAAALPHLADDYMGEHWLASFALLALLADL
jgi:hypothetical protein